MKKKINEFVLSDTDKDIILNQANGGKWSKEMTPQEAMEYNKRILEDVNGKK